MKYLALALLAQRALSLTFSAPFKQAEFDISGDSRIADNAVDLVHGKNQKGAIWSKDALGDSEFTLEAVIRSAADLNTEIGKSGFTLWYTSKRLGAGDVHGGPSTWDGLAIMIDSLATGGGGSVRGHLNDGTTKFWNIKSLDTESLSLCRIDYRNAAGAITIRMGYSENEGFVVDVNGQKCFLSTEIVLPKGYFFGISANSDTAGDTLSVEKLEATQGLKPELRKHLPQFKEEEKEVVKPKAEAPQAAAEPKVEPTEKVEAREVEQGVTKEEIQAMLEPALTKVELINMKMGQVQSVVDQLVETLTLSMNQITEMGSKEGSANFGASKEIATVQREIQNLRGQISDWRKQAPESSPHEGSTSNQPWFVLAVMLPVQFLAVLLYHSWLRRRERHQKLL